MMFLTEGNLDRKFDPAILFSNQTNEMIRRTAVFHHAEGTNCFDPRFAILLAPSRVFDQAGYRLSGRRKPTQLGDTVVSIQAMDIVRPTHQPGDFAFEEEVGEHEMSKQTLRKQGAVFADFAQWE